MTEAVAGGDQPGGPGGSGGPGGLPDPSELIPHRPPFLLVDRLVELEPAIDKLPSELSGGMRRRVGIARAIVNRPRLVLYDSPTAGLDPITAHTITTLILKERDTAEVTSVVVSHRLQNGHLLANFHYDPARGELVASGRNGNPNPTKTQFLVLNKGRLVFRGSQEELSRQQDPYVRKFVLKR